jgi:Fe-S cluster biogenesis protein NfuA
MTEKLESLLGTITPFLRVQGKDAKVVSATPDQIQIQLVGFCGGCGCSSEYVDGLKEMIAANFPDVKEISIITE